MTTPHQLLDVLLLFSDAGDTRLSEQIRIFDFNMVAIFLKGEIRSIIEFSENTLAQDLSSMTDLSVKIVMSVITKGL